MDGAELASALQLNASFDRIDSYRSKFLNLTYQALVQLSHVRFAVLEMCVYWISFARMHLSHSGKRTRALGTLPDISNHELFALFFLV
jgi:hypothetical protein